MNILLEYRDLVNHLFNRVKPLGYKKTGTSIWRDLDETRIMIGFQRSQRSNRECIVFTVNLSVICRSLLDPEIDDIARLTASQGHLYWRIGDLYTPAEDKWWKIDATNKGVDVSHELSNIIIDVAVPLLEGLASYSSIIRLLDAGKGPPMSETQQKRLLHELMAR